jgi:hypothetical protein
VRYHEGGPLDTDVHNSLRSGLAKLAAPDWGGALAQPERMSVWDLGVDADGLRHVGFRGQRRFEKGTDPAEWEGTLVFKPDEERVLSIEAWPVNQAEISINRLARYRRSTRLTLDLGFLHPLGRTKRPPKVRDLRMLFREDGSVLEQMRTAKLTSSFEVGREHTSSVCSLREPTYLDPPHSQRRTTTGSTRVARRAGR